MNTKQKIFCGVWVFAIIASAQAATTTSGITNKASRFSDVLSEMGATTTDSSNSELAETIRRQRALLDAQADKAGAGGTSNITTANACDAGLRKCMTEKCDADFTKCAKDSTTVWGNKMDACRRNTKCTGHEYTLLAPEILADRNAAIELSYYNSVVNCGNKYNNCIFGICGKTLDKCLSKSAGDSAMAKCKSIADECKEYDNGLVGRVSGVFGDLRTVAAAGAQKDEKRLYELRNLMRTQCTRFGAMFDERTLDCVYTVNFFAGEDHTLMASKKLYSGDTFQCTPDWFGVDITTYMENAQRLTRSQKGASAAAMGAGLGTAASLWTSGAVGRAIDTQNAEKQAKDACIADGGEWVSAGFNKGKKCDMTNAPQNCEKSGGKWDGTKCVKENNGQSNGGNGNGNSRNDNDESDLSIIEAQCNVFDSSICNGNGNCKWDDKANNGKGKCVAKTDSSTGGGSNPGAYDTANGADGVNAGNNNVINPFCGKLVTADNNPAKQAGIKCTKDGKNYSPEPKNTRAREDYGAHTDDNGKYCFTESIPSGVTCIISYLRYPRLSGTIEQLNQNKTITLCSGTINQTIQIGTNCEKPASSTTSYGDTKSTNKNSTTPSLTTAPKQDIDKSIQENIDQTCQTTCQSLAKKLDKPKIINLDKPACKDTCKPIIEEKCKTFETQLKTSQVTISCNNETCNYTCKLIEKEKPTINCTEFDEQNCFSNQTNGCEWTTTGCKQKTQIKASSITSMQKTSDTCAGCKKSLIFDNKTYTCGTNTNEGIFAMYNSILYVCDNNYWKDPSTTNYFDKIKNCNIFKSYNYKAVTTSTKYFFDTDAYPQKPDSNGNYGVYNITKICKEKKSK